MWALLISLFVASVVCAFKLVHTFTDWADRLGAAHITAVAGLSIAFFISALVPVDVANAGGCSLPLTGAPVPASERDEAQAHLARLESEVVSLQQRVRTLELDNVETYSSNINKVQNHRS